MATSNGSFSLTLTVGIPLPGFRKGADCIRISFKVMLILGIETSCDETGLALYDAAAGRLAAHAVHSQVAMHEAYGGVVPELASRDHIRRLTPLTRQVLGAARRNIHDLTGVGYTAGPGLAGALLVGASFAHALGFALRIPAVGIHHLEGHLLSPLLSE